MEARQRTPSLWHQVCLGQREPGEQDERIIQEVEGWILGGDC